MKYLIFMLPIFALGAEVNITDSDIIARTINFIIFFAICWYLIAGRLKSALSNRSQTIADRLSAVQKKLEESKLHKDEMLKKLDESKELAENIVESAIKEAQIITQNIESQLKNDIELLKKSHNERLNFEVKKMKKVVINEVIEEILSGVSLDKKDYLHILNEKVA